MATWRDQITLVQQGDAVAPATPNTPISQLAERTQYLKDRIDTAALGEGIILSSQPISSDVAEGDVVYYNKTKSNYQPALATSSEDDNGLLRTADKAYVIGVVVSKVSDSAADILISGRYKDITLTANAGVALAEGHYYLSGQDTGKLVSERPAVGIFVLTVTSQGIVLNPTPREVLEDHIHYRFDLNLDPAGNVMCIGDGDRVALTDLESDREGWLPADHSVFAGTAPVGAKFGYNLWANNKLAALWPPQPSSSAFLELTGVGVQPNHAIVDKNGIWWMTDCRNDTPWDREVCQSSSTVIHPNYISSSSSKAADATTQQDACEAPSRHLVLWFTKMLSKTDQAAVTGIKPADGSPIVVTSCSEPNSQGYYPSKVELDLNIPWDRKAGTVGSEVVKTISGKGELGVGHIVEGVKGAGLVKVTGTQLLSEDFKAGRLTIEGLDPASVTKKIDVQLVALSGAVESIYESTLPYVGLVSGRANNFIGKLRIPDITMTNPRVKVELWFGMTITGPPPANVTISHAKIDPASTVAESSSSGTLEGKSFPKMPSVFESVTDLSLQDLGSLDKGEYFARKVLDLKIESNQLFLFKLARSATDGYNGELAVINMTATIYEG